MTVGILLITHTGLGHSLLRSARAILAAEPAHAEAIDVPGDSDPDAIFQQALATCRRLDSGDGVLVLTDLYGSTPSNIAGRLTEQELGKKAIHGARDGMVMMTRKEAS
jgi:PTS system ascorbate-specific IIA component